MEVNIKKAKTENPKDIQKLNLMLFEKEVKEYDPTLNCKWTFGKDGKEYFGRRITKKDGCALIAILNCGVVGYLVAGLIKPDGWRDNLKSAELENMFVLEEHRNAGIGKKLYLAFIEWCKSNNVKRVNVVASAKNIGAIKFYKRLGFKGYDVVLERKI